MNVTLTPEFDRLLKEKLEAGEYRSADDILNAAMGLFKEREEDRAALRGVNAGERLEMLLEEAAQSGEPTEMTSRDWDEMEQRGIAILKSGRTV